MKMIKVIVVFLVAICIFTSVCAFDLFAQGTRRVYAETNASIDQGECGYCYVYLDDLTDLAALNVAVHYDTEKLTITDSYNQVSCSLYDSSNKNGCLQYSYIFDGEGSKAKNSLFYFCYKVNENAEASDTCFDIVVTDAYNSAIEVVEVCGSRCDFTIIEKATDQTVDIHASYNIETSIKEEFEITYSFNNWQIASGSMVISYNPELFEIVEVANGGFLNGKSVDVNKSLGGLVYLSFGATEYNSHDTELLKVKFRTLKNVTENSEIKLTINELFDLALNEIVCNGCATNVAIIYDATYTDDPPSMAISASYDGQSDKVVLTIHLDKNSMLGAGDFVLSFDATYLMYNSAQKGFSPSFFNINDKNVGDGVLKFSIISLTDITDAHTILTVVFDVNHACYDKRVCFEINGNGIADSLTNSILLNFVNAEATVPLKHLESTPIIENIVGASCTRDGSYDSVIYCSKCDKEISRKTKTIDKLGHDYTEQKNNSVRTIAANCQEFNTYWYDCSVCDLSAKYEASADDKWYMSTEVGAHIEGIGWEYDFTHHWLVCSMCGEEIVNSRVNHSGGIVTCQANAECSTCGATYGGIGDHDYDTTKWVSVDESIHAHKCKFCLAHIDEADHFSENEKSCIDDMFCDACGYKMKDACMHIYTKQIEISVYLKAEGADCQSRHTYYYVCEHCDASSKNDSDTFYEGAAVGSHNMSQTWTTEYDYDTNSGYHYHKCTVDGCGYKEDEGNCAGGERTCITLAICSTCQKAYGTYAEHSYGTIWENDENEHWNECECGNKGNKASHVDDDHNSKCDTCDYTISTGAGGHGTNPLPSIGDSTYNNDVLSTDGGDHDTDPQLPIDAAADNNGGLNTDALIGIAIAAVAIAGCSGFVIFWFVSKRKN